MELCSISSDLSFRDDEAVKVKNLNELRLEWIGDTVQLSVFAKGL